jgi:hypothetical protein
MIVLSQPITQPISFFLKNKAGGNSVQVIGRRL